MKISFIIPVFNAGVFLNDALNSIYDNLTSNHDIEIILIDDCSTDQVTLDLLKQLQNRTNIKIIRQPENGGPAKARNAGIRSAKGEWICFLDADDMVASGSIEFRLSAIEKLPEIRWLVADILEIRQPDKLTHDNHFERLEKTGKQVAECVYKLKRPTAEMLTWSILPVLGAMMIRRDLFTETGLFDEALTYGEDVHFCLLLTRYADLYWIPQACLLLRRYHNSMTKDLFRGAREMPKASLSLLKDYRFLAFKKQLRWQHAANLRLLSGAYLKNGKRMKSFISAASALYWVPNDPKNIVALTKSLF